MTIKPFKDAYKSIPLRSAPKNSQKDKMNEKSYFEELEDKYGKLTFGNVLKSLRECEDETQSDFARRLGLSVEDICALEEERIIPSLSSASLIAKKLYLPETTFIDLALRDGHNFSLKGMLSKVS